MDGSTATRAMTRLRSAEKKPGSPITMPGPKNECTISSPSSVTIESFTCPDATT